MLRILPWLLLSFIHCYGQQPAQTSTELQQILYKNRKLRTILTELNGGIMNAAKSRVQIAYTGQEASFQKELIARVSDLFLYDMLFGGSLKEVLQNSILLTLPEWFMKGIPAYLSADLKDPALKDQIIQMIRATESKKLNHLTESEATLIGLSIWWVS